MKMLQSGVDMDLGPTLGQVWCVCGHFCSLCDNPEGQDIAGCKRCTSYYGCRECKVDKFQKGTNPREELFTPRVYREVQRIREQALNARGVTETDRILDAHSLKSSGTLDELMTDPFTSNPYDVFHALAIGIMAQVLSKFVQALTASALSTLNRELKAIQPDFWTSIGTLSIATEIGQTGKSKKVRCNAEETRQFVQILPLVVDDNWPLEEKFKKKWWKALTAKHGPRVSSVVAVSPQGLGSHASFTLCSSSAFRIH